MIELKVVHTEKPWTRPNPIIFESIGPIIQNCNLWLFRRDYDGKDLVTSPIESFYWVHENICRITTRSQSIYEIKQL